MLVGAPLLALTFAALFFPPMPGESSPSNTVYFCFVFAAFNCMNSFTTSPYTALLAEVLFLSSLSLFETISSS